MSDSGFSTLPAVFEARDVEVFPAFVAGLAIAHPDRSLVVVTPDSNHADFLTRAVEHWWNLVCDPRAVMRIPEIRGLRREWVPENEAARCLAFDAALSGRPSVFIAEVSSLLSSPPPAETFRRSTFTLSQGERTSPDSVVTRLVDMDYDNEPQVSMPGEFAGRGGILDIFSPIYDQPVRLDFFGDDLESIRFFDPETQRSCETLEEVRIVPRGQAIISDADEGAASFLEYFEREPVVVACTPGGISDHLERFGDEIVLDQWQRLRQRHRAVLAAITEEGQTEGAAGRVLSPACYGLGETRLPNLRELGAEALSLHWQLLRDNLAAWHRSGCVVAACCGSDGEAARFREMLDADPKAADIPIKVASVRLQDGLFFPDHRLVLLSERELFGKQAPPPRRRRGRHTAEMHRDTAAALEEGCFAVHAVQGICIYHGVRDLEAGGALQEVMELEFADEARLFVPLDQSSLVTRYVGGSKRLPRLSKIGSAAWKNNRLSAQASAEDLAAELLRLEALRQSAKGYAFSQEVDWEADFAAAFPYAETEDQSRAIEEVLRDMVDDRPMDRLICGDVGYGKTEVAMRAAFRAVMAGRQVAVLVPTTVLAQQHYNTFRDRMAEYPVVIEMLSRFKTHAEQNLILEQLALGRIDIVIGTHRLIQKDVAFAELGLLIIDEEQRFGVKHKERLKQLRASVDILTMTATPIPRTLYFSLSGLRNLSTIMTPPAERMPVKTVVAQFDKALIRDAIMRELEREGQVFLLHNRVRTIEAFCRELSHLVPEARFAIAHGQMPAHELEAVMLGFVQQKTDVLVCTTIIESGLDIPNANTIIIDHSERFGLAELYQLRGRVGRYHNQAYAYLLLPPMGVLPRNARERIAAIRQYTQLGAGFKLALRDLEIRGAGNILGQEQSGHIAAVGFELYCELLRDAVARLEQRPTEAESTARVTMDTVAFGVSVGRDKVPAAIPPDYVPSEEIRIDLYKRLQGLHDKAALTEFADELRDRFGPPSSPLQILLAVNLVRVLAEQKAISEVRVTERRVLLTCRGKTLAAEGGRLPRLQSHNPQDQLRELAALLESIPPRAGDQSPG